MLISLFLSRGSHQCPHQNLLKNVLKVVPHKQLLYKGRMIVLLSHLVIKSYALCERGNKLPILGLASHIAYERSCTKKPHTFNDTLRICLCA